VHVNVNVIVQPLQSVSQPAAAAASTHLLQLGLVRSVHNYTFFV